MISKGPAVCSPTTKGAKVEVIDGDVMTTSPITCGFGAGVATAEAGGEGGGKEKLEWYSKEIKKPWKQEEGEEGGHDRVLEGHQKKTHRLPVVHGSRAP